MSDSQATTLVATDTSELRKEMGLDTGVKLPKETQALVLKEAKDFADQLLSVESADTEKREDLKAMVENLGLSVQKRTANQSKMLQEPIKNMANYGEETGGKQVADSLVDLQHWVEDIDPSKIDFGKPGWFGRIVGTVPVIGKKMKKYFAKYQKSQTVINAIIHSLENSKKQLIQDNQILGGDQKEMRENTIRLAKAIELALAIDAELDSKYKSMAPDDPEKAYIGDELLFPLRQRSTDLLQQLQVNQQGVLAMEIIVRNNRELIKGVDRANTVTVSALQVAVTVAIALGHQKMTLDKIDALNKTTSNLIAGTASRLRKTGVEIHKQASSSMLETDKLKQAFTDLTAAMNDIHNFRQEALPQMARNVLELDDMAKQGEEVISRMERGNVAQTQVEFKVLE